MPRNIMIDTKDLPEADFFANEKTRNRPKSASIWDIEVALWGFLEIQGGLPCPNRALKS